MLPRYLAFTSLLHLLVLVAGTAAATPKDPSLPRTMRLEYTRKPGAADCPDEDTFRYVVAGRMADSPFAPQAPDRMVVTIGRRGPSYQGLAEIRDATGASLWSFQTTQPECHLVADALGIAIGLALDKPHPTKVEPPTPEHAAGSPTQPAASPEPPPPAPPAQRPPQGDAVEPKTVQSKPPVRLAMGVSGGVAVRSAAPIAGGNLAADVGLRFRSFSGSLEFRWDPVGAITTATDGSPLVRVDQFSGSIVPCGHARVFFYCGIGEIIAIQSTAAPGINPHRTAVPAVGTGARVGVELPLPWWGHRFAVRLSADLHVTLREVTFHVGDKTEMDAAKRLPSWSAARVAGFLSAGVVTDLWLK